MKTQPYLDLKASAKDRQEYKQLTMDFILAIFGKDLNLLADLLDDEAIYLDGLNKWQTLNWFRDMFNETIPEEMMSNNIQERISLDAPLPGKCLLFFNGYLPVNKANPSQPKGFTLRFANGRICGIWISYKMIDPEQLKRLVRQN